VHIFKLGHKYTNALDVTVSGPDGKPAKPIMGCYGIGVERAMAAVIEVHHDAKGIVWPAAVAPFDVVVTVAQQNDEAVAEAGEQVSGGSSTLALTSSSTTARPGPARSSATPSWSASRCESRSASAD
jgi:prolyl-tRNA synthetase